MAKIRLKFASGALGEIFHQPAPAIETRCSPPDDFERNHLFVVQTQHFLKVAVRQGNPICALEDGLRALEMAVAAKSSQSPISYPAISLKRKHYT
jgi:hypothetical protein